MMQRELPRRPLPDEDHAQIKLPNSVHEPVRLKSTIDLFSRVQDFIDDKHKMTPDGVDRPASFTPIKALGESIEEDLPTSVIKKKRVNKALLQSLEKNSADRVTRYAIEDAETRTE